MKNEKVGNCRIRCYDNGGKTFDRYSVVFMDFPEGRLFFGVGMSYDPFSPCGFGQHGLFKPGKHLGKRIAFADMPADCQKLVESDCQEEVSNA